MQNQQLFEYPGHITITKYCTDNEHTKKSQNLLITIIKHSIAPKEIDSICF